MMSKKMKVYNRLLSEERIKNAALELFAKHGFKATTTRMIAKLANSNIALIARYFGSKQDLFLNLIEDQFKNVVNIILSYPPQDNLEDEIRLYLQFRSKHFQKNLRIFKLLLVESILHEKYRQKVIENMYSDGDPYLKERLNKLYLDKKISQDVNIKSLTVSTGIFLGGSYLKNQILLGKNLEEINKDIEDFIEIISVINKTS